jgi:hypothetical protein
MKQFCRFSFWAIIVLAHVSCVKEELPTENTPEGNFEALWQLMDEHYCFFDYKQQTLGVDWDEVYVRYRQKINPQMTSRQLFEVLCQMIGELKDGHVNLGAAYDLGRNWSYYEDYPRNFDTELIEDYLGKGNDYQIAGGLKYRILDDNIGYVRCESFDDGMGDGNISLMFDELRGRNGLIIDIRENGGGKLTNAHRLASHFTNEKTLVGYVYHKTGKGHRDFSSAEAEYVESSSSVRWQKQVVVLTNRRVFSAANDFVKCMRQFPNVTIMGDRTGGGSGMPFMQELPIGWSVRYSAVVSLDADKQHTEFGIDPDVQLQMDDNDLLNHRDTYIEAARKYLSF